MGGVPFPLQFRYHIVQENKEENRMHSLGDREISLRKGMKDYDIKHR
jgi:hypothetical protein